MQKGNSLPSRRDFLKVSSATAALSALGTSPHILHASDETRAKLKPLIIMWLDGGASNRETFEPAPKNAPEELRGERSSIATTIYQ